MPIYEHENVVARFTDKLGGMSVSSLLQNWAVFHVKVFPPFQGELFSLISPDYKIQMLIKDKFVIFRRNEYEACKQIQNVEHHYQILASWRPDKFQLALIIDDEVGGEDACVTINTSLVYVPIALMDWARRLNLLPRKAYTSATEFLGVLLEALRQTEQKIRDTNCHNLFWDRQRSKTAESRIFPKREPETISGIAAFLHDHALIAGYEIVKESQAGAGSLDIRVVAPLANGRLVNICVEGKNAHSADLDHGITDQLPAYMASVKADYGIYLVLWYKCKEFLKPRENGSNLTWRLTNLRPWETVVIEKFDLGIPSLPSERGYRYS